MILGRKYLREYCREYIRGGNPAIEPNSIDLTLHNVVGRMAKYKGEYTYAGLHKLIGYDPERIRITRPQIVRCGRTSPEIEWELCEEIILAPGDFRLVCTAEDIEIPYDLSGDLLGKSTLARDGLQVEAAGLCDSGYRGNPTLELKNLGDAILILTPGDRIAQLRLTRVDGADPSDVYHGKYQDIHGPSGSRVS